MNAKVAFALQLPSGEAVSSNSFQNMLPGWSLIAVGDSPKPSEFNKTIGPTQPVEGEIPLNLNNLWAWDNVQTNWYFYAPDLEKSGELSSYIQSKGYLGFGARTLNPGTGFWVNKP